VPISLDAALGIHPMALSLRAQRAGVLAANLANADTPQYKARDVDFAAQLRQASSEALAATHSAHFRTVPEVQSAALLYRVPTQPAIDGNTVDTQVEQAEFGRNAVQYQASLSFLGARFRTLLSAIRGE
jgi:flagellar basal-body rod protein FlgB